MRLFQLKSFGRVGQTGNEVWVVQDDALTTEERLQFANGRKAPATVFMQAAKNSDHAFDLDFFYPHTRSRLCFTAALAASFVYFAERPAARILSAGTAIGPEELLVLRRESGINLRVKAQAPSCTIVDRGEILAMLGLRDSGMVGELAIRSVGSPKLLVEVQDREVLYALRPDLEAIVSWGGKHGVSGCYAYCRLRLGVFAGRNFNHLDPALEDAATGTAAGALGLHLEQDLILEQGDHLGNPCSINVAFRGETVEIGGRVVLLREESS